MTLSCRQTAANLRRYLISVCVNDIGEAPRQLNVYRESTFQLKIYIIIHDKYVKLQEKFIPFCTAGVSIHDSCSNPLHLDLRC